MKEMFLLGAGASIEAGVPGAFRMTEKLLEAFEQDSGLRIYKRILRFVVGGLLFQRGVAGDNPYDGVNVEELFNAVQLLSDRGSSEIAPFVSSWHPLLSELEMGEVSPDDLGDLLDEIYLPLKKAFSKNRNRGLAQDKIDQAILNVLADLTRKRSPKKEVGDAVLDVIQKYLDRTESEIKIHAGSKIQKIFTDLVRQATSPQGGGLFRKTGDLMLVLLTKLVWVNDPSVVTYLIPLLQYAIQTNAVISTLNYDNTIELAGSLAGIEVETGFELWSKTGEFQLENGKVNLLKLHGSIDWALTEGWPSNERPMPFQTIHKIDMNRDGERGLRPAVIFGGKNKLTAKGPFLDLLRTFEQELSRCDVITAIGYSFRDEHINEFINEWLNANQTRVLRVVNPSFSKLNHEYGCILKDQVRSGRVKVIEKKTSEGILEVISSTLTVNP